MQRRTVPALHTGKEIMPLHQLYHLLPVTSGHAAAHDTALPEVGPGRINSRRHFHENQAPGKD